MHLLSLFINKKVMQSPTPTLNVLNLKYMLTINYRIYL